MPDADVIRRLVAVTCPHGHNLTRRERLFVSGGRETLPPSRDVALTDTLGGEREVAQDTRSVGAPKSALARNGIAERDPTVGPRGRVC